jgi:hypothetical protein
LPTHQVTCMRPLASGGKQRPISKCYVNTRVVSQQKKIQGLKQKSANLQGPFTYLSLENTIEQ